MNRFLSLLFACCLGLAVYAKDEPLDTVLQRLSDRIYVCLENPDTYDEARRLLDEAMSMKGAEHSAVFPGLLYHQSTYYLCMGDMERPKPILHRLLGMLPVESMPELDICVPQDLGVICRRDGLTDSAFYYYDRALQAAIAQGDKEWMMAISLNVGILHYNLSHYEEAERYLDKAVSYAPEVDDPYTELCAMQVRASVKIALHKLDEGERSIRRAWTLAQASQSVDWQVRCLTTLVWLFDEQQLADSARLYLEKGNALLPSLPRQHVTTVGFVVERANHYYMNSQWREALDDYLSIQAAGMGTKEQHIFERMARCYGQLGQWREAYCYMDSARMRSDTIATERIASQMADFNVKYQTMEKELEIERLHAQRLWFLLVAIGVLLVAVVLWLWHRSRRQRREAQMRISTLESERKRIAKELHDGLCNDMLALEMQMQFAGPQALPALQEQLNALRQQARHLSHQLMPPEFTHVGLNQLLHLYVGAMQKATHIEVSFTATPADDAVWQQLSHATAHEVYRIAQEQAANIVKGRTAKRLALRLEAVAPGRYQLTVTDDGQPVASDGEGMGHRTLNDRITALGGRSRWYKENGQNVFELEFFP